MISEWIISLTTLIISIYFFILTFQFPEVSMDPGGLSFFPRILCLICGSASLVMIAKLIRNRGESENSPVKFTRYFLSAWKKNIKISEYDYVRRMTYVFAASVIYPWLIVRIGFVLSTILYSFTLMKLFKTKTSISLFISASVAIGLFSLFCQSIGSLCSQWRMDGLCY